MQMNQVLNGYGVKFNAYMTLEEAEDMQAACDYAACAIIEMLGKHEQGDEALLERIQNMRKIIHKAIYDTI